MKFINLTIVFILLFVIPIASFAQMEERYITVTTEGVMNVFPDEARLIYRITNENLKASEAIKSIRESSQRFKDQVKELKLDVMLEVEERGLSISSPNTRYSASRADTPSPFTASNEFILKIPILMEEDFAHILDQLALIIDSLAPQGFIPLSFTNRDSYSNEQSMILYVVSNPEQYEPECQKKAVELNRPEAEEMARAMGVQIVGVRSSNINQTVTRYYSPLGQSQDYLSGALFKPYEISASYVVSYYVEEVETKDK